MEKQNSIKMWVLTGCLVLLGFNFNNLMLSINNTKNINSNLSSISSEVAEIYVNDIIRKEQRDILNSIKQSYVKYVNESNIEITEAELLKHSEAILALDITASTFDMMGENGGIIAYNTITGEVLMNTSSLTVGRNIYTNNEDSEFLTGMNDSDSATLRTYDTNNESNLNDFNLNKLGSLNRLFIEKVILPFEHIGFSESNAKITLLSIVLENDISQTGNKLTSKLEEETQNNIEQSKRIYSYTLSSIVLILISVIVIVFSRKK